MKKLFKLPLLIAVVATMLQACKKEDTKNTDAIQSESSLRTIMDENGNNPDEVDIKAIESGSMDERHRRSGYVYTETNAAGSNEILIFRQHGNGNLASIGSVSAGGNGTGMGLGSQGALIVSHNEEWLIAVNAGSNSISAFQIANNGMLTLTSTVSSMGVMPVSVTMHHNIIYVVNSTSANIAGFELDPSGALTSIPGSVQPLSNMTAAPAQISFAAGGDKLYVTEKMTNKIAVYDVVNDVAQPGSFINSTGVTPFGYDFARGFMIVSNATGGAVNASTVTSYGGVQSGNLNAVSGPVPNNQTAACWVASTKYQRFAYVTNTGSDNISSYYIGPNGNLYLIAGNAASSGDMPLDIVVADNNYHVYALCSADNEIFEYRRNFWGTLSPIGSIAGVPASAAGLAVK
jgi:6-phosphogluconolactonase